MLIVSHIDLLSLPKFLILSVWTLGLIGDFYIVTDNLQEIKSFLENA